MCWWYPSRPYTMQAARLTGLTASLAGVGVTVAPGGLHLSLLTSDFVA